MFGMLPHTLIAVVLMERHFFFIWSCVNEALGIIVLLSVTESHPLAW